MLQTTLKEIITQETKVKVIFNHKIENFGFLLGETFKDIESGIKVDVPLYVAHFLLENNHCTLVNPILSAEIRNDLKANSSIINLSVLYTYFYNFLVLFENNEYVINIMFSRYNVFYKFILKEELDEDDIYLLDNQEKKIICISRKFFQLYRNYFIKS